MAVPDPDRAADRRSSASRAALLRVSQVGGATVSAPARNAFLRKFENQVDPDGKLTTTERQFRANAALRAHMVGLAAKSRRSRATLSRRAQVEQLLTTAAELTAAAVELEDEDVDGDDGQGRGVGRAS